MKNLKSSTKLLLVLVLIGVLACGYYLGVYEPTEATIKDLTAQNSKIETQIEQINNHIKELLALQPIVEEGKATGTSVPAYDSSTEENRFLSSVVSSAVEYNINFSSPERLSNTYAKRQFKVTFSANSYMQARDIISRLYTSLYRTYISDVIIKNNSNYGITDGLNGGIVRVELNICFIEDIRYNSVGLGN